MHLWRRGATLANVSVIRSAAVARRTPLEGRARLAATPCTQHVFEAVRDAIVTDGALEKEGRNVLAFTEYTAIARHLHRRMREAFGGKEVLLIHGGTGPDARQDALRRFAPLANLPEGERLGEG